MCKYLPVCIKCVTLGCRIHCTFSVEPCLYGCANSADFSGSYNVLDQGAFMITDTWEKTNGVGTEEEELGPGLGVDIEGGSLDP